MADILYPLAKRTDVGELANLTTTVKTSVVGAVNEVVDAVAGLKENTVVLQGEINSIENVLVQSNPNGDAKITVTSFDTVNSLPKNAAQAGLGVVQEGMTASNLVAMSEFISNGGTGTVVLSNGEITHTITNVQTFAGISRPYAMKVGDVYYLSLEIKPFRTQTAVFFASNGSKTLSPQATAGVYTKVGALITADSIVNSFAIYDNASVATDMVIGSETKYRNIKLTNLTAIAKQAATLSQADSMLLDYFSGTQSAVTGRVRSVGKNLFDGEMEVGSISQTTGQNTVNVENSRSKNYTKIKPSYAYKISVAGTRTAVNWVCYDKNKNYISTVGDPFTAPSNCHFIKFWRSVTADTTIRYQLEPGTVATTYEPYRKTESYTKPMLLRRVPNNTTDDVTNGKHTKRVSEWANVAGATFNSIDNATYTNVSVVKTTAFSLATAGTTAIDNSIIYRDKNGVVLAEVASADIDNLASIGKFYYHTDKTVWRILAKGSDDIATARTALGTETILYQLLAPVVTENVSSGTLLAYPSGTVYWEPVVADVAIYASGATILNTGYPISTLESIYKIDLVTGEQTPLDVASATVAGNGLSFTHTGLSNGDLVGFTYYFAHALPYGENDYVYLDSREVSIDTAQPTRAYRVRAIVTNGVVTGWATEEVV